MVIGGDQRVTIRGYEPRHWNGTPYTIGIWDVTLGNAGTTTLAFGQTGGATAGFSSRSLEIHSNSTFQEFWTYLLITSHQLTYRRDLMRLEGKIALVTGAATGVQGELMGIGGATAWVILRGTWPRLF